QLHPHYLFWCVNRVGNVRRPFGITHGAAKADFTVETIRLMPVQIPRRAAALVSSLTGTPVPANTVVFGEMFFAR
ncbi:MAG: hypothetical protein V3R74_07715, partial [Alphaproteobacteria bacterium]